MYYSGSMTSKSERNVIEIERNGDVRIVVDVTDPDAVTIEAQEYGPVECEGPLIWSILHGIRLTAGGRAMLAAILGTIP